MSLINEALKRARQAHAQPAPPAAAAESALSPTLVPVQTASGRAPWIAPATGFLALILGLGCLGLYWLRARPSMALAARPATQARVLISSHAPALRQVATPAASLKQSPPQPAATNESAAAVVPTATASASTNSVKPPPTTAPLLGAAPDPDAVDVLPNASLAGFKLQGIFVGTSRAVAMINGRTVARNDEINGAKVLAIERQNVLLLIQGRTNILKLH